MSDDIPGSDNSPASDGIASPASDASGAGRRQGDRRKAQLPFEGPDRRKGDRRSGTDRRASPRDSHD
jgi:hypothetical protein